MSDGLDTWAIVETGFDVRHNRHYEGLLAIGSGPLQQRASLEEGLSDDPQDREFLRVMGNVTVEVPPTFKSRVGTYLPGVTGPHPTCGDELINLPALHGLVLYSGNERLDMERSRIEAYERRLDLRCGRLRRTFIWHTQRGAAVRVSFERFISASRRHVMALRCRLEHVSGPAAEVRLFGTLDADVRTNGFDHFTSVNLTGEHAPVTAEVRTNGGDLVAAAALLTSEAGIVWNIETGARWAAVSGLCVLEPGTAATVCKFAAMTSSRHVQGSPLDAARNLAWRAAGDGYDRLAAESDEVWQQRWAATDVDIDGDERSQLGLRAGLYHLMRAAVEHDARVAIDPKAAAGEAYCGRYFWDTELFILPVFLYTRPDVARALAGYRLASLPGARRNAQRYGYAGARYAWEASPSGDEHCPNWQYADHEVHVTADVAYGLWHAHLVSPADVPLLVRATEVLSEASRYWADRVSRPTGGVAADLRVGRRLSGSEGTGGQATSGTPHAGDECELLLVMGPDEYTPFSRNNAYTNYMVATTLRLVARAWQELEATSPADAQRLRDELQWRPDEAARVAEIADKLPCPYDASRRLVLQSDDFFTLEPFDFDRWWPDRSVPVGRAVSQERLYRSQVLKQADVVLLMTLFPHEFGEDEQRVAYDTYAPLTSHDSSLSRPTHALLAARLGREQEALRLWDESVALDLAPDAATDGVHAAGAGGLWQAAVLGFGGVRTRMQADRLMIEPRLPERWRTLRFPLVWDGQPLRVAITTDRVTITHQGTSPVEVTVFGRAATLEAGSEQSFSRPATS
ncbi:MAG: glycosyl hydrolase family 65 protein [Phycisphaerae bacterium]|jgi:kojibiose phosphorylase